MPKKKEKKGTNQTARVRPLSLAFTGAAARSISREEIYHRLNWYFDPGHNPVGPFTIAPNVPISALLHNLGLADLFVNINRASDTFMPAWNSQLFHGVDIPYVSAVPGGIGIQDIKTFGDLVTCTVAAYKSAGWTVTDDPLLGGLE